MTKEYQVATKRCTLLARRTWLRDKTSSANKSAVVSNIVVSEFKDEGLTLDADLCFTACDTNVSYSFYIYPNKRGRKRYIKKQRKVVNTLRMEVNLFCDTMDEALDLLEESDE